MVFARVEDSSGAYAIAEVTLDVITRCCGGVPPPPGANPIYQCDGDGDGFATFDLVANISVWVPPCEDNSDHTITFYTTSTDAENAVNAINSPSSYFTDTQFVYIRVEEVITGDFYLIPSSRTIVLDCSDDDDNDDIVDIEEDVNSNNDPTDDDTDDDGRADYLDDDDDDDLVPSALEIDTSSTRATFLNTDGDLLPDHRDPDDDGDGVLTRDEDYNGNGDPTDDDVNMNGIPDYLDPGATLTSLDFFAEGLSIYPNPVSNELHISIGQTEITQFDLEVYTILGKKVFEQKGIAEEVFTVQTTSLPEGTYFLKMTANAASWVHKFVVKR